MVNGISKVDPGVSLVGKVNLPSLILEDGEMTTRRFVEFFTAQIRNKGILILQKLIKIGDDRVSYFARAMTTSCHWAV